MDQRARRALGSAALITATLTIAAPARAGDACVQTRVTEDFVSPDGKVRGPGVVKVCPYWTISPSLRLSRVLLDGNTLGVWMTRAGEGGRFDDGSSAVVLRRLPEGRIALADYYWPGRDGRPVAPGLRAAADFTSRTPPIQNSSALP
jgi:hypothetical protein